MTSKRVLMSLVPMLVIWYILVWDAAVVPSLLSPIVLWLCAAALVVVVLRHSVALTEEHNEPQPSYKTLWLVLTFLIAATVFWSVYLFNTHPIDIKMSDILPLLKEVYYTRWINNEYVYARVLGYDYVDWTPNYLPMHWMPFIPAFYFNFDPRLVPLFSFIAVQIYYVYKLQTLRLKPLELYIKAILPFLFLFSIMHKQPASFAHTVELLIVSYYTLLALALQFNSMASKVGGLVLTTLSRYAVLFFAPIHVFYTWMSGDRKSTIYTIVASAVLVAAFYIVPYVLQHPMIFFDGAAAYDLAALGEWKGQAWQAQGDKPYQLFQGYGCAAWFYQFVQGNDLMLKIKIMKILLLSIMIINMGVWIAVAHKVKNFPSVQVAVLFVTLVLFFSFVLVPYNYLFWNILFLIPVLTMKVKWFS